MVSIFFILTYYKLKYMLELGDVSTENGIECEG